MGKKFLAAAVIFVILVATGVGLILLAKLILLDMATTQLGRDYRVLRQQAVQGNHSDLCFKDSTPDNSGPVTYQLRFVSPTEYILEVVCFARPLEGIEFARYQLTPWVMRSGGAVGLIAYQPTDPIQIQVMGVLIQTLPTWLHDKLNWIVGYATLVFQDNNVTEQKTREIMPIWTKGSLRSNCQAFGYTCCDGKTQTGRGQILTDTLDCSGQCFPKCLNRPLVLSFGADGGFDPSNRTVETQNQVDINFSYVGQAGSSPIKTAVISFGDGQKSNLSPTETAVTHQYNCNQLMCKYDANVTLIDADNQTSPISALTILQVVVRN